MGWVGDAGRWKGDEESAVLDPLQTEEGVGQLANRLDLAAESEHLEAVVVADVDVEDGDDQVVVLVLEIGHLGGEFAGMVVIDEGEGAKNFALGGSGVDARLDEGIAHQITKGLGAVGIAPLPGQLVEALNQFTLGADAKSNQVSHLCATSGRSTDQKK